MGINTSGGLLTKQQHSSQDPYSKKPKRATHTMLVLTKKQKAAAFTNKLANFLGVVPPHATNLGLGKSLALPDEDPEGSRHYGNIMIFDKVLN